MLPSETLGSGTCAVGTQVLTELAARLPEKNLMLLRFRALVSRGVTMASITDWATF